MKLESIFLHISCSCNKTVKKIVLKKKLNVNLFLKKIPFERRSVQIKNIYIYQKKEKVRKIQASTKQNCENKRKAVKNLSIFA